MMLLDSYPILLEGALTTLTITAISVTMGLFLGSILTLFQTSGNKLLDAFARAYINTFRSIPLVMLLLSTYLLVPPLVAKITGAPADVRLLSAIVTFSLYEAALFAAILKSGFNAINSNQYSAAYSMGFSKLQTYLLITMPQAIKKSFPVLITQTIIVLQNVSLVYVIGLSDFFGTAVMVGERDGILTKAIMFASFTYLVVCVTLQRIINKFTGEKL